MISNPKEGKIFYTSGYKYQLERDYHYLTDIISHKGGGNDFVSITTSGMLHISRGYAWDGASGPAPDVKSIMRASLVHDALYQLIRMGIINRLDRDKADRILQRICVEAGMYPFAANLVYAAVKKYGADYTEQPVELLSAP